MVLKWFGGGLVCFGGSLGCFQTFFTVPCFHDMTRNSGVTAQQ